MRRVPLIIFGAGKVGRALPRQVLEAAPLHESRDRVALRVAAWCDRDGAVVDEKGIPAEVLAAASAAKAGGARLAGIEAGSPQSNLPAIVDVAGQDGAIVVDVTATGETVPALELALARGYGVATANKVPLTGPQATFETLVRSGRFRYESTVGSAVPVIEATLGLLRANDEIRSIRAAAFNFDDMAVKAGQYLDKIRGEAAKILASAQKEAVAIRQRAEAEGRQAGQNAVEQTVQKQLARQLATLLPALQRAVEEVQHSRHAWLRHWEKSAVHTAAAIAARLVRRERIDHPEITVRLVREALELASGSSQLRLHLNPADHAALAPKPEEFPVLLDKLGGLLGGYAYDWSAEVAALAVPVLVAVGDADSLSPAHAAEFFALLGGGLRDAGFDGGGLSTARLAVLPRTTHYDIVASSNLWRSVVDFLAG